MEGFDPCPPLNEPMGVLMEEKQGYTAAFDQLISDQNGMNFARVE